MGKTWKDQKRDQWSKKPGKGKSKPKQTTTEDDEQSPKVTKKWRYK